MFFSICSALTFFSTLLLVSMFFFCLFTFLSVRLFKTVTEIGYNPLLFNFFSRTYLLGSSVLYSTISPVLVAALYLYKGIYLPPFYLVYCCIFIFICIIVLLRISKFFSSNCDLACSNVILFFT